MKLTRNHSNVTFVKPLFLYRVSSKDKLHLFMSGRIHSNVCDYICSKKWILVKHFSSVHEKKKPFECDICAYTCSWKVTLFKTHIASVHEGKKPFKCHVCDAKFSNKPNMKRHINPITVICVSKSTRQMQIWKDTFQQFKKGKQSNVNPVRLKIMKEHIEAVHEGLKTL